VKASKNFVLYLNVTARIDSAPDQGMLAKKGANYFPYVIFMDSSGEVLTSFRPTSEKAVKEAFGTAKLVDSIKKQMAANPEDRAAAAGLKLLEALTARTPPPIKKLDALAATPGLDARVAAKFKKGRQALVEKGNMAQINKAFRAASIAMRDGGDRQEILAKRNAEIYRLYKKGIFLKTVNFRMFGYFAALTMGAAKAGDDEAARKSLANLEKAAEGMYKYMDSLVARGRNVDRIGKQKKKYEAIVQDIRKKARFLKPSERRRKKALKAEKRRRTEALKAARRATRRR